MRLELQLKLLLLLSPALQAAVVPQLEQPVDAVQEIGYLELKPNGTLILRHAANQSGGNLQNLLLLRSVLQALKLQPGEEQSKLNFRIYGDGVEQKFPPLLENIIQRIQTFFSIYRYTDTSRPVRKEEPTTEQIVSTRRAEDPKATQVPPQQQEA
ncbi:uncharacterized protein LOC115769702 [Drosophila novamexicana]|uniref:uncharacterized protein LOC115769702 n=1 Tax=Drosophila novamexicana TaxID=47314 RepID=UPI0011E5B93D|nr:uncharacterized protein LOC115769702 [Drosophila novamexicana]